MNSMFLCYAVAFLAEALTGWLYLEYIFDRKRSITLICATFFFGYSFLLGISQFGITALNAFAFCVTNLLLILLNYRCAVKTAFLHAIFLVFLVAVADILADLLVGISGYDFAAFTYNITATIVMAILGKSLYLVFCLISAKFFAPHKYTGEEPHMMALFCGLPLLSAIISVLISYLGLQTELTEATEIMIVINIFALLTVNLVFMVLYNHLQKVNAEYLALQLSIQKEKADAAYYHALQMQSENQRILVHDIKNHLRTIDSLARDGQNGEIADYISRLDVALQSEAPARLCNEPILNLILLRVAEECREKQIDFHCDVRDGSVSFLDAPSTTTLFGNLLSNAVEAAENSNEKIVELSVVRSPEQSSIVISAVNSCDTAPVPYSKGHFRTKKSDATLHGVGLKCIERVVHRYHGIATMYFDSSDHRFHHIIQFPA